MRRRLKNIELDPMSDADGESRPLGRSSESDEDEDNEPMFAEEEYEPPPDRFAEFRKVATEFTSFRPASEVFTKVRAVPTIFTQFDHATKVGGLPIERFTLLHGPSGEGKTFLSIGFLLSFLMRNHLACLIDAERTTPITWLKQAMGDFVNHPFFFGDRPKTYEATVAKVRSFVNTLKKLRDSGKVDDSTSGLIIIDSIRKLVPEDIFKKITQATKSKKKEKVRDRSAQIKAAMNSAWLDELVPLLEETGTCMIIIARETDDPDADQAAKMFNQAFKVGGGRALYYDASLVLRVERAKFISKKNEDADGNPIKSTVYGERHRITIRKTKVSGKEDRQTVCYYHTSNGVLVPEGFDRARDILELAQRFEIVKGTSWLKFQNHRWQGEHMAVKKLHSSPQLLIQLENAVREKFSSINPMEITSDGEVLT